MQLSIATHTGKNVFPRLDGYGKKENTSKFCYDYYPFGLQTANSWTRDNTTNNFLYDAGSELNTTTAMYDLPNRNYDAALGRFFQVDPLSHMDHTLTPYHYAGNNPIGSNDPSGLSRLSGEAEGYRPEQGCGTHHWANDANVDENGDWRDAGYEMNRDAALVRAGMMSLSDYVDKYGSPLSGSMTVTNQGTGRGWTVEVNNRRVTGGYVSLNSKGFGNMQAS